MGVYERPNPYDQWDRYKLPLRARITLLFLSKNERKKIKNKIDKINRIRRLDLKREIEESMKNIRRIRPGPQRLVRE